MGLVPGLKFPSLLATQEYLFPSGLGLNAAEEKLAADFRRMTFRSAPFSFEHPVQLFSHLAGWEHLWSLPWEHLFHHFPPCMLTLPPCCSITIPA